MLDVGLCMTVRDEAANIVDCLAPIKDLFAEILVIDTGSVDETHDLLRDQLGIDVECLELFENECLALSSARNQGFDKLKTPWLMSLDADERIDRRQLIDLFGQDDTDLPAGLFFRWDTDFGDGELIEDYKLALFRADHRHRGLIHDTPQPSLRDSGEHADWHPDLCIRHFPSAVLQHKKDLTYSWRLECALAREPDWMRYHWFGGQMAYRRGDNETAGKFLRAVHAARPALFPVESLNASMVLASVYARRGDREATLAVVCDALDHYESVADDFEVRINFRLRPWLDNARELAASDRLAAIKPYAFPY
ncbi:MAG: glycosyltransferase [Novosphingobium sp.]|nr:glycosyltransferase [Novosphingobium sp.]